MKTQIRSAFLCVLFIVIGLNKSKAEETSRIKQLFNFDWKFMHGDIEDAQNIDFDDSNWRTLDLPHDFQIEQPWKESAGRGRGFKEMSAGWYRKSFTADTAWIGQKVLLNFEGIMLQGDVWLNGKKIGKTDYGYLGFESDISNLLRYDTLNVVAVKASTGKTGGSRWYTGGGLYRDVHLIVKNQISVARHGVFITTPDVSENKATVNLQVDIEGFQWKRNDLTIEAKIYNSKGELVAQTRTLTPKGSKKISNEVPLPKVTITNPDLWNCETPNLYKADITLSLDGQIIDNVSEQFGIRSIVFSKEKGFLLNGKKVFLKGISNHHDLGAVGAAAHETAIERQMDLLKKFGYNHIRCSHNPYSEAFLRIADEKGILIVNELYDKWSDRHYWAGRKPWTHTWHKDLTEWVKRDRNHPSVIMWSLGNELQMREDLAGYQTNDWGVTTYKIMDILVKRYDPTRKTTVAMYPARAGAINKKDADFNKNICPPELATVTEVSSFNYRWMDYQEYLKHAPHMIVYQSEATTNELLAPYFGMDRNKMVGLAYWGAIEYWGESRAWPIKGWNYSFFDHSLNPFPQAYLVKSAFSEEPIVHIGVVDKAAESQEWNDQTIGTLNLSDHWNRDEGKNYNLYTFTNAEEVELYINNKSLGTKRNDTTAVDKRNIILWNNVPYENGEIVAIARTNNKEVARYEMETTGKAAALKIETENPEWKADGMDLQYIRVYAVDKKGRKVQTAKGEVTIEVSGAARLIAIDNGNHESDELFNGNKRLMHKGSILAILRSEKHSGKVNIIAKSEGIKSAKATILVK
ncbi:glycoside hydrolase family 2 TIM barrel-domain containing protein [Plebeiibacterium marinum]|uniref:DUF4982 domain-containing protein n=1 Tax=Plebeiibacterium marinum TaxID=2992111 RepID=A0AAE3SLT0_9BACT|nr:glycoside hydrolase family 2 TIM barrel-domain containing protein [Plebeiobacterium marinum]MCW3808027.1 DUF4982 domain-containing protein [Plebeiobacterium marinum]